MASHRLIRSSFSDAGAAASVAHDRVSVHHDPSGRRVKLCWPGQLAGAVIGWELELEQGANGVLAHLSVGAGAGVRSGRRIRWWNLVSQPISARMLGKFAAGASRRRAWAGQSGPGIRPARRG
jgi:hypothetical protein